MSTYTATPKDIEHRWHIVDADGMVLGRLATEIVRILRGKHKPMYTPHMDTGDNVIVINAAKVKLTGRKARAEAYFTHTGYMGHERFTAGAKMLAKHPERMIEKAVYGMLRRARSGAEAAPQAARLHRADHPHVAQQPDRADLQRPHQRDEVMADSSMRTPIGRRKEAVCRVYIAPGSGKWDVNGRTLGDYFPRAALVSAIQQPFTATDTLGRFDVKREPRRRPPDRTGRGAASRGRPRDRQDRRETQPKLRGLGLLTRDARAVERKKPGRPKARKRFQF